MTSTILNREGHDGKFLWLLWEKPPANTPFVNSGNVNIIARVRSRFGINADKPDSTWPDYTRNDFFYSELNAIGVGKRLADWFAYQGLTRDKGQVVIDGVPHAGGIFTQDWGTPTYSGRDPQGGNTGQSLLFEHADKVSDVLTVADFQGYTNAASIVAARSTMKHSVGFMANAIARSTTNTVMTDSRGATHNIMGLSNWIRRVMQSMKDECDARNLCYPRVLAFDLEGYRPPTYLYTGYSNRPSGATASSASPGQFPPLFKSSVLRAMQADARYSTETVYQEWSGNGWVNKTMQDAWNAAGGPTGDPDRFFAEGNNVWFARRWQSYLHKIADYAMSKMLYEPVKEVFPGILCGNYETSFQTTSSVAEFDGGNYWFKWPANDFENKRHLHTDYQSPVLYSPNISTQPYKHNPARYNPNYAAQEPAVLAALGTVPGGLFNLGHPFGGTASEIYRNFIKTQIDSAATRNPIPLMPWYELPGARVGAEVPNSVVHTSNVDEVLAGMTAAYETGTRIFLIFNERHASYSQSMVDTSIALFDGLRTYINSKDKGPQLIINEGVGGVTGTTIDSPFVPRIRFVGSGPLNQALDK